MVPLAASDILKTKKTAAALGYRHLEELRVLGDGGHGSVSLCKDQATGMLFALKTAVSEAGNECLKNEFDAVQLLMESGVEGIVGIHDIDEDEEGKLCLLMGFCNKGSLISVLGKEAGTRLKEREAAGMVRSLARTLRQCHSNGIMHRDIKLDNVLVHCNGHGKSNKKKKKKRKRRRTGESQEEEENHRLDISCCKFLLSDFGLACSFRPGHHIRDGRLVGTPEYMAPEFLEDVYDERADIWSLGVLLHVVLTGAFPAQSSEMARLLLKEGDQNGHRIRSKRFWKMDWSKPMYAHLTQGAKSVLAGMLEKKPRRRISLNEICEHPWVNQLLLEKEDENLLVSVVPSKKKIRLVCENDAPAPSASALSAIPAPPLMDSAGAGDDHEDGAPLLIRIKFGDVIIREFLAEHNQKQKNPLLLPIPPSVLPAFS